jgi:hypothetical protein
MEIFAELKTHFTLGHVASVVIGMGAAMISDVLFNFYSKDKILSKQELKVLSAFSAIVWVGLGGIIITGLGIFLSNPEFYASSDKFLIKMTIVGILTLNGYVLARFVQPHLVHRAFLTSRKERTVRRLAFACGAISLVSWIGALVLGLLSGIPLAYLEGIGLYMVIILASILIAVTVEKKTFEAGDK